MLLRCRPTVSCSLPDILVLPRPWQLLEKSPRQAGSWRLLQRRPQFPAYTGHPIPCPSILYTRLPCSHPDPSSLLDLFQDPYWRKDWRTWTAEGGACTLPNTQDVWCTPGLQKHLPSLTWDTRRGLLISKIIPWESSMASFAQILYYLALDVFF